MPIRFRGFILALLLLLPATVRAQTPDAATLVRRMRERAAANVQGVRSYTVAYEAGGVRMAGYAELAAKHGRWDSRVGMAEFEFPVRGIIANTLQMLELTAAGSKVPVTFGEPQADTAAGRTVYSTQILPRDGFGEDEMESLVAMVDAETYDVVRFVSKSRRGSRGDAVMTLWTDLLEYRDSAGVRLPGRYLVRVWNAGPASEDERAEGREDLIRRRAEAAAFSGAERAAREWTLAIEERLLETGILEIPITIQLVAVNQPPPPEMAREDDRR
ncbi:hypothetical protein [Longimicrobium terrae]|uniref:Uncharacterized protein n=1 Tax=Longimicrobium terrae TaxID=1639882 RepID=A0A841GYL7_9BACT|nr:hypothetical protein [Longimicrobium terrae]MBB4636642.1 hypothetical protein [Longimicrobium terrae]MBB6070834.1 hypothetical protein [Longimicrobium terrae]NNC28860.1 hypothetical protein [Longimicrobium terrae]